MKLCIDDGMCNIKIFGKCFNLLVKVGIMKMIYYHNARW